jgi:hypothetical protein
MTINNDDYGRPPTPNLYKEEQRRLARQRQQVITTVFYTDLLISFELQLQRLRARCLRIRVILAAALTVIGHGRLFLTSVTSYLILM